MTNERTTCIDHHVELVIYYNHYMKGNAQNISGLPEKIFHAKRLFNCWNKCKKKKHFSLRQGTSFSIHYCANSYNNIVKKGQSNIYRKSYRNFTYPSYKLYDFSIPYLKEPPAIVLTNEVIQEMQSFYDECKNYVPLTSTLTKLIDLNKVPDYLIPYIPDHLIYNKGDISNQLTNKQKAQLKPLQAGSKAWKDHV
ncbi:hypothetical protein C1646_773501 [Rhizophagus diaphanus]|nr:hypothetical protein C1646_773501 [Rhizophagus diaphanus] [Rhizophagus sp. MUCL 43196]